MRCVRTVTNFKINLELGQQYAVIRIQYSCQNLMFMFVNTVCFLLHLQWAVVAYVIAPNFESVWKPTQCTHSLNKGFLKILCSVIAVSIGTFLLRNFLSTSEPYRNWGSRYVGATIYWGFVNILCCKSLTSGCLGTIQCNFQQCSFLSNACQQYASTTIRFNNVYQLRKIRNSLM